ncbi:chaperone protein dnaK, putative [Entamoeba histolytica HM-1:IMSS-B]|uniref:Chaperone protein dnaK, putative n=6 Tax=Entamoeba histolytica TaxID=5759 RepID=C4M7P0_ENTH1|nr:chaperone protein dnaK, putative [Entamoeba histolytica HM-1:IMSS]EMD44797.1 chaperone protein DNAK, putative [Entamoeba histolytica KU27]EMH76669.1 chaperone protein dnaK, putative [Entamoeba histolytica HM-1:IMSS-B]EMS16240.1 chaperone protein DNAK, putative [Entamoeba histolytica HM-3:IMSS]ENY64321.1 chaperone protein DNAK, putative [Entamoeba histolytica HM-1:IMSS-A]GAT97563.1 chaperone protein DNAk putative [Entamoeba histolytica]|eukprot:XP_656734.1 chaperone protein dnaK, putative [Entamoeba histolytica HM-1:IMSS]
MNFLGIDVGSKHSLIAHTVEGSFPTVVSNKISNPLTPSCIVYEPASEAVFIGDEAIDKQMRYPQHTINNVTTQPTFNQELPYFYHTLLIDNLLKDVEMYLKDKLTELKPEETVVTLTIPSEMEEEKKELYKNIIKGHFNFKEVLTLSDIEAAALCLKTMHSVEKKNVLIVDIGAHHTTAAVFSVGETIECISKESAIVGGNDFDKKLIEYAERYLLEKQKIDITQPNYIRAFIRTQRAVEKARILLSTIPETNIEIDGINDGSIMIKLSRELMQQLIHDELYKIEEVVKKVVNDGKTKIEQVEVIGGTGRAPNVVQIIKGVVGEEVRFLNSIDSACSIALGGAVYAERSQQNKNKLTEEKKNNEIEEKQKEMIKKIDEEMLKATTIIKNRERKMWILNDIETKINQYRRYIESKEGNIPENESNALRNLCNEMEDWLNDAQDLGLESLEEAYKAHLIAIDSAAPTLKSYLDKKAEEAKNEKEKAEKMRAEHIGTGETARKRPEPKTNKEKMEAAEKAKEKGTKAFKDTDWIGAIRMYSSALGHVEAMFDMGPEEIDKCNQMKLSLYLNLALCYLKVDKLNKALDNAESALKIDGKNVKGLFRKGMALNGLKKYEEALVAFKQSEEIEHSAATVSWIKNTEAKIQADKEKEKRLAQKMFGF